MKNAHVFENLLPSTIPGRLMLGCLSALFILLSAIFLFPLTFGGQNLTLGRWLVRVALWEFFAALLAASFCGLAWAVATPNWLPPIAERWARRLSLFALIPFLVVFGWLVWPW